MWLNFIIPEFNLKTIIINVRKKNVAIFFFYHNLEIATRIILSHCPNFKIENRPYLG